MCSGTFRDYMLFCNLPLAERNAPITFGIGTREYIGCPLWIFDRIGVATHCRLQKPTNYVGCA